MCRRGRREGGSRIGEEQHQPSECRENQRGQHRRHKAQDRAWPLGDRSWLGRTQARGRGDEHGPGHAAADRRLGQRHVHGGQTHPG